jgi:hypothetical protein
MMIQPAAYTVKGWGARRRRERGSRVTHLSLVLAVGDAEDVVLAVDRGRLLADVEHGRRREEAGLVHAALAVRERDHVDEHEGVGALRRDERVEAGLVVDLGRAVVELQVRDVLELPARRVAELVVLDVRLHLREVRQGRLPGRVLARLDDEVAVDLGRLLPRLDPQLDGAQIHVRDARFVGAAQRQRLDRVPGLGALVEGPERRRAAVVDLVDLVRAPGGLGVMRAARARAGRGATRGPPSEVWCAVQRSTARVLLLLICRYL